MGDFQQFARIPECPDAPVEIMSPDFDGSALVCNAGEPLFGPANEPNDEELSYLSSTANEGTTTSVNDSAVCAAVAIGAYHFCMSTLRSGLATCLRSVAVRAAACVIGCGFSCFFWVSCAICLARCAVIAAVGAVVCLAAADAAGAACLAALYLLLEACGFVPNVILPEVLRGEGQPIPVTPLTDHAVIR